jgi:hypothetical protein
MVPTRLISAAFGPGKAGASPMPPGVAKGELTINLNVFGGFLNEKSA